MRHHKLFKIVTVLLAAALLFLSTAGCTDSGDSSDLCKKVAGVSADTVLLTIDGRDVTAEEYLYWACLVLDTYYYYHVYGTDYDDETCSWVSANWDNGLSATVLGYLLNYNEPIIHAEEMGLSVDEEELASAVDTLVSASKENYADDETFELYLSQICMSQEGFRHIMEENVYYQRLMAHLYSDGGEYAPSDEALLAYADDNDYYACKYVFFSTATCYGESAFERVRAGAQQLLDNLAACDDPDAYFSAVITDPAWNDDTTESEDGLVSTGGTISTVFDEAVRSLDVGEFSDIVDDTASNGYFVIQRLAVQPDDVRDTYCAYSFNQLVSQWGTDADVEYTKAYENLNFQNFYVSLANYRLSTDVDAES